MMALADNPRAIIGSNGGPALDDEPEKLPPKSQRIVDKERWHKVLIGGTLLSARFKVARKRILANRTGGDDGRALRRFLIVYARSLGSPVWECAETFDLNRKQISEEVTAYLQMLADNPALAMTADNLTSGLDYLIDVDTEAFLKTSIFEIEEDAAAKRRAKADRKAGVKLDDKAISLVEEMAKRVRAEKRRELQALLAGVENANAIVVQHMGPKDVVRDMSNEGRITLKKLAEAAAKGSYPRMSAFDADCYDGGLDECEALALIRSAEPYLSKETDKKLTVTEMGGSVYLAGVELGLIEKPTRKKKAKVEEEDED